MNADTTKANKKLSPDNRQCIPPLHSTINRILFIEINLIADHSKTLSFMSGPHEDFNMMVHHECCPCIKKDHLLIADTLLEE